MPLLTYEQVRPWARAIRSAVLNGRMPPWFADPDHGAFSNAPTLSPPEIATMVSWVDRGAPSGVVGDAPAPVDFVDGWTIGEPDVIVEVPTPFHVPAHGTVEYQYIVFPTPFHEGHLGAGRGDPSG